MITKRGNVVRNFLTGVVALVLICCVVFSASAERIPRVLLAGDSWTGFMLAFRSYRDVLDDRAGLERWIEVGNRTAVMGVRAWEILELEDLNYFNVLTNELTKYPNIDVVVMTLGGNDILRGTKGVDPTNYDSQVRLTTCYSQPVRAGAWSSTEECIQLMANALEIQIGQIVDHILSIRPDIRVAIVSYDYGAREPSAGYTIADQHLAFIQVEMSKRNVALARDRVDYVNNFGLMQYLYGIPQADPPIPQYTVPYPCYAPEDPGCSFWPGGMPEYLSPLFTYIDQDIHLTDFGYRDVANRSLDFCIEEWLNYPKALEILPLDNKAPFYQFQVTFSHPVVGVTADDFDVLIQEKGDLKAMGVTQVVPATGPADIYTVTVDMDGSQSAAYITVMDDDSITRSGTGVPLGGTGAGNGEFVYNGLYEFVDLVPPGPDDFDHAIQYLYMASQAYEYLLYGFSFNPDYFDGNGDLFADGNLFSEPYIIPGNALLDRYEFSLIKACIDNPTLNLTSTGGLNAQVVKDAWNNNFWRVQQALGGADGLALLILPGLDTVFAGFVTLGDFDSLVLSTILVEQIGQVEEFPFNTDISYLDQSVLSLYPEWLAFDGDASGNGWTNEQMYAYYAPDGVAAYVSAALNPAKVPKTGEGHYWQGRFVRIAVLEPSKWNSPWQWYRNGQPLVDDGRITGANRRNLDILSLQPGDEGAYTCDYIPKSSEKNDIATYGPILITVSDISVPVGGVGTFALSAVVLGALGIMAFRRKRT